MRPTIKVSIASVAFNVDEDAYKLLDNYLQALRNHFQSNAEGKEIIVDIELRLCELLQIRTTDPNRVITLADAKEITEIMGNPTDFGDAETQPDTTASSAAYNAEEKKTCKRKKLYRDPNHKILGGVCTGIGHYLRIDPFILRLLAIAIAIIAGYIAFKIFAIVLLIYCVLWIIIPKAATFAQKMEMTGTKPSVADIEDRNHATRAYRGSGLLEIVKTTARVCLIAIATITSILAIALIIGVLWLLLDNTILNTSNYLILFGIDNWHYKLIIIAPLLIILLGIIYLSTKRLRRSGFTSRSWSVVGFGIVMFLVSVTLLAVKGIDYALKIESSAKKTERMELDASVKTIYITMPNEYLNADIQPYMNPTMIYGQYDNEKRVALLPKIITRKDTSLTHIQVSIETRIQGRNALDAKRKCDAVQNIYTLQDSTLTVSPIWYNNQQPWQGATHRIVVRHPAGSKVVISNSLD